MAEIQTTPGAAVSNRTVSCGPDPAAKADNPAADA